MDEVSRDRSLSRDQSVHNFPDSPDIVPRDACPCPRKSCNKRRTASDTLFHKDETGCRVTQAFYSKMCQREKFVSLEYSKAERRKETFKRNGLNIPPQKLEEIVAAGLYVKGPEKYQSVSCFCCQLSLRILECSFDPMREHARWSPNCQYVKNQNGVDYIHTVLQDTMNLKEHTDEQRPTLDNNSSKEATAQESKAEDAIPANISSTGQLDRINLKYETEEPKGEMAQGGKQNDIIPAKIKKTDQLNARHAIGSGR